jgi:hypothetical protein
MSTNQSILQELQKLDEQRTRCESAIKTNGTYLIESLNGLIVYIDEGFDKTALATKLNNLKHKTACAKLKLINERIKFLTKQLK